MRIVLVVAWLLSLWLSPACAAAQPEGDALAPRAGQLIGLFNSDAEADALFAPSFLAEVPPAKVKALAHQVADSLGAALQVAKIDRTSSLSGTVTILFERGTLGVALAVEPDPPHRITTLLTLGSELKNDSFARIEQEMARLPGQASLAVATLSDTAQPSFTISQNSSTPLAVGSAFKLFLLAELARATNAGERGWADVVPLDRRSLPSGQLQNWPAGAPLTLHSLAALMISVSDNSAADTLLHRLGREKVEALLPALGVAAAARDRPLLSTLEAFALKTGDPARAAAWAAGDEARRRALLAADLSNADPAALDLARLAAGPNRIDTIEWFASGADLVRTMDWLRRSGGPTALGILAINSGIGKMTAGHFAYVGFKGGSEPGVVSLTYLLRTKAGRWLAVSGIWNDKTANVDEAKFAALIGRAVALLP